MVDYIRYSLNWQMLQKLRAIRSMNTGQSGVRSMNFGQLGLQKFYRMCPLPDREVIQLTFGVFALLDCNGIEIGLP